jgi:uncharacterized protein YfkK (UPF0435 family)
MAERRVFLEAAHESKRLRIILTSQSKVLLELGDSQSEFETLEDAYEFVLVRPEEFSSGLYQAFATELERRGGGGLV